MTSECIGKNNKMQRIKEKLYVLNIVWDYKFYRFHKSLKYILKKGK